MIDIYTYIVLCKSSERPHLMKLGLALQSLKNNQNGILNFVAYGHLIQHFSDRGLTLFAKQLHARLVLSSVTPSNFLAAKLIHFYAKTRLLPQARHLFDEIPLKNTFAYNAMLISYSTNTMHHQVLQLFSSILASSMPDHFTISCVLKSLSTCACGKLSLAIANQVHGFVKTRGLDDDVFVENALITYYSKCEDLLMARRVFDRMRYRDVVSWNAMIAGYSQSGLYDECKGLYNNMLQFSGLLPNGVTVVSVLQACGQSRDLVLGMEVHRLVVEYQVEMDILVCNALIGMYAKCGSLDYASKLTEEMSEKDEVTYCAMVSGYMLHGFVYEAMNLFRQIETPGLTTWNAVISGLVQNDRHLGILDLVREMQSRRCRPNAVTLSSTLPALSCSSDLKGVKEIHSYAIRNNLDQNNYVATATIDAYAKTGFLKDAKRVFSQCTSRSLITFTAIISSCATHGDFSSATSLFDEMLSLKIQPDPVTLTAILTACAHAGVIDEAWKIFNSIFPKYGIEPSVEHYACMAGALSRGGRLSEAFDFLSKMPFEPSAKVWGTLLNGASLSGDVELGKFISNRLFEIEPDNTGNYIVMANLYSQAGRWEEADMVREKMNRIGTKKVPGSSWIETTRGFQNFNARE